MNGKRFIAGAICPKCAAIDTLVVYKLGNGEFRECVSCGFKDKMMFKPQMKELTTRVNKSEEESRQETQVIKLLDANKK